MKNLLQSAAIIILIIGIILFLAHGYNVREENHDETSEIILTSAVICGPISLLLLLISFYVE